MANLPLAFAELVIGGIVVDAAIKGASITDVVTGKATGAPFAGLSLSGTTAGGGPAGGGGTVTGGKANPLPGLIGWERTDQGRDASAKPGSPVQAIVGGTVRAIVPNWYSGQPEVIIDSPGLPGGATGIYYAEQLIPTVHQGQTVKAGEQIATVASSGTGLEIGFSQGLTTLAQATTGYVEGAVTAAGRLFDQFLGVPA